MKSFFFTLLLLATGAVLLAQDEKVETSSGNESANAPETVDAPETLGGVTATAEAPKEVPKQEVPDVRAGEGVLVGVVFDGKSGNPLGGVAVILTGADKQTITNDRGEFKIEGIIPGEYELILTQGGFEITSMKEFVVQNGKVTLLRKGLEPKPVEGDDEVFKLEAVEVVAELVEDGSESLLFDRKEFAQLTNAIGSEDFSKQDLGDAAAAMSRVAAVNVVDGKYAVIRGLGDRYSNTTLNGALIPSADPSKKAVQLDLIPTHLLRSILTFKQFTPDLWAEFAGGSVDLQTLQFPKELLIKLSAGMGFSENATGKKIAVNPDRRLGFFGANDSLPSISGIREFPGGERRAQDPPSEKQILADKEWTKLHLNGGMLPDTRTAGINTSLSLTLGNTFEWGDGSKLGMVFAFNQGRDYDYVDGREINRGSNNQGTFDVRQSQVQDISTTAIDWGALLNLSFSPVEDHSVSLTIMSNNAAEDQVRQGRFLVDDESGTIVNPRDGNPGGIETVLGKTARIYSAFDEIAYLERSLNALQFQGDHRLDFHNGVDIDWILSFSTAEEDRPDQRHLKSFQLDYAAPNLVDVPRIDPATIDPSLGTIFTSANPLGGNPSNSFREYLNTFERATNAGVNVTVPVWHTPDDKKNFVLKSGIGYNEKQRDIRGRLFKYDFGSALRRNINNDDEFGVEFYDDFDSDEYIDGTNRGGEGLWIDEQTRSGNTIRNLDAFQDINAAYLMGTLSWNSLKITGGFRFEQEERGFNVITELNREEDANRLNEIGPQSNSYVLPALSAVYTLGGTEDEPAHFFRVAYGRTIARPTFYEYAPIRTVDQATGLEIRGNGALDDTLIDNFDLRWEWYPAPTDLVSISLFHKQMDTPIVTTVGTRAGSKFFRSWDNSPAGFIQGIELEYRKQLNGWFQHFLVSTNFTYIRSEIEPIEQEGGGTGSASVYEGQPSYIFNLNLGYDNPDTGWAANLVYNYTGEILTDVSADDQVPNIFKEGFSQLDFVVSKTFQTENFLDGVKLKLAVKNILDSEVRRFYEGESLTYDSYFKGRSFSIGASWEF